MMISVVIPCYNRSEVLADAIATALEQTYRNCEVVVVDDGSDDVERTEKVVNKIADPRVRLIKHSTNRGQTAATNMGMESACGKFIALLDTDDRWDANKLELQLQRYLQVRDPLAVIYSKSVLITIQSGTLKKTVMPDRELLLGERVAHYLFCERGFIQSSGIFFSRELVESVTMREGLRRHTDYDFLMACERHGCSFHMCHEPLVDVDWRDAHLRRGARDMSPSFEFLECNRTSFDAPSRTQFVLSQILIPLLCGRERWDQQREAWREISIRHLGLKGWVSILSSLLFSDDRMLAWGVCLKKMRFSA